MMGPANRRRAEEFDALLSGGGDRQDEERYADLLAVVGSLREAPEVQARPAFVADLRTQLVAAAERQDVRVVDDATARLLTPRQRRGASERKIAVALGGFAVVAATGSMAMASQGSLPGDVLYPVKRAIENAETNLRGDETARAATLLEHAEARLAEVEALAARDGQTDSAAINDTLEDFKDQSNQAAALALDEYAADGDQAGVDELRTFSSRSMERLTSLSESLPTDSRPSLVAAAQNLTQIDQAARQQCPECGGSLTELPTFAIRSLTEALDPGTDPEQLTDIPRITAEDLARGEKAATRDGAGQGSRGEPAQQQPDAPRTDAQQPVDDPTTLPTEAPGKQTGKEKDKPGLLDGTVRKVTDGLGLTSSTDENGEETEGLLGTLTDLLGLTE